MALLTYGWSDHPILFAFSALLLLLVLRLIITRIREESKIRALGGHAATRRPWSIFGFTFIYEGVTHFMRYDDYAFFRSVYARYGNPKNPWTVEFRLANQRVINTSDEENIKAILATQFHDFGKGRDFNRDFHDFLGDSMSGTSSSLL